MEAPFIQSINDVLDYIEENKRKLLNMKGICSGCLWRKRCLFGNKEMMIESILHLSNSETRFAKLLNLSKAHPGLLYAVPSQLYKWMYGMYTDSLPCPFLTNDIVNNIGKIESAYELLTDDISKLTYLNMLMYRMTGVRNYSYRALSMDPSYFIPQFRGLGRKEIYVDCGAYNGDTLESYCLYNDFPKMAYLFEPDKANLIALNKKAQKYNDVFDVKIIEKGVYKQTGELNFVSGKGMGSYFKEYTGGNGSELSVTSIDAAINEEITFIKMDIEGFEKEALLGAQQHINQSNPKLAICIYHYISDLWEIPLLISKKHPQYAYFEIRQHSCFFVDTVLYVY